MTLFRLQWLRQMHLFVGTVAVHKPCTLTYYVYEYKFIINFQPASASFWFHKLSTRLSWCIEVIQYQCGRTEDSVWVKPKIISASCRFSNPKKYIYNMKYLLHGMSGGPTAVALVTSRFSSIPATHCFPSPISLSPCYSCACRRVNTTGLWICRTP